MTQPTDHPAIKTGRIGVMLVNLGSPAAPEPGPVRRYLRQFLSDKRVVEIPALVWQPILNLFVLTTRPRKSAHAYSQIWWPEGSPLIVITARQATALQAALGPDIFVDHAMRYGEPALADRLAALKSQGCDRILIAPLYPQYSGATTATVVDEAARALAKMRWQPAIRTLPAYHDDPLYIAALKTSIEREVAGLDFKPDALLASFHSVPERTLHLGDPYHCQCQKTARLLSEAMAMPINVSFQSKLGRAKWLEPATDATLAALPAKGIRKLAIIAPGFSADNLETLEELAIRGKETFLAAGGTDFAYLPCLNDSEAGITMLTHLVARELGGWHPSGQEALNL